MGQRFGYARVSTTGQTTDLQHDALRKAGCDRIFTDTASGAKAHRPELDHMLDMLRDGDTVIVWRLDRLGRSVQNLVELMNRFQTMHVGFVAEGHWRKVEKRPQFLKHGRVEQFAAAFAVT